MSFMSALLPAAPSWYPGHMNAFIKRLPVLLANTDIILELRDTRMPLTSINPAFEKSIQRWRADRRMKKGSCCERIIVYGKSDLVSEWGLEPFRRAMQAYHPDETFFYTAKTNRSSLKTLHGMLVNLAREYAHSRTELNVLIMGMPNVGKSSLLNGLRVTGIPGAPKALRTSALPGMTRTLSTRLKLYDPPMDAKPRACPIYAFDTPGLMLPFLGHGVQGKERGIRLALIAALKEGMYDYELLATYLVHKLNILQFNRPLYLPLLVPKDGGPVPTDPLEPDELLEQLCIRRGMLQKGGQPDIPRAAQWFVEWWRARGALVGYTRTAGWGLDFSWADKPPSPQNPLAVEQEMMKIIEEHFEALKVEDEEGERVSKTHKLNVERKETAKRRKERLLHRLALRKGSTGTSGTDV